MTLKVTLLPTVTDCELGCVAIVTGKTGITEDEALEALPVPTLFVAVTVKVYAVPLVRPVTVIGEVLPLAVTAEPPLTVGGGDRIAGDRGTTVTRRRCKADDRLRVAAHATHSGGCTGGFLIYNQVHRYCATSIINRIIRCECGC